MRLFFIFFALLAGMATLGMAQVDDGFDDRGFDRNDRTPEWNYRRGENEGKGAYYDGGRYGPRGLLPMNDVALDPWLTDAVTVQTLAGSRSPAKANRWFRKLADRNRDALLTDAEIQIGLVKLGFR